jgi:uncharacterized membrane protein
MKKYFGISIPLGAILSFGILIYMISYDVWNKLSGILKFLMIIGLIVLFFYGEIKYERRKEVKE